MIIQNDLGQLPSNKIVFIYNIILLLVNLIALFLTSVGFIFKIIAAPAHQLSLRYLSDSVFAAHWLITPTLKVLIYDSHETP